MNVMKWNPEPLDIIDEIDAFAPVLFVSLCVCVHAQACVLLP